MRRPIIVITYVLPNAGYATIRKFDSFENAYELTDSLNRNYIAYVMSVNHG